MGSLLKHLSALSVIALALAGCSGSGTGVPGGAVVNSGGIGNGGTGITTGGITGGGGVNSNPAATFASLPATKLTAPLPAGQVNYSFDISFVDPGAGYYYLADRTTNGVDAFSLKTLQLAFVMGAGAFTGYGTPGPGGSPSVTGGPNGIVPVTGTPYIFAGDGNGTTKVVTNGGSGPPFATIPSVNPITAANLATFTQPAAGNYPGVAAGTVAATMASYGCAAPTSGAGNNRADEMAYDPADNIVMVVFDASCPPFANFYSSKPPFGLVGTLAFPYANAGAEQPIYDAVQKKFLLALPATVQNAGGEIEVIDPKTFLITNTFGETNCNANGLAQGKGETIFLGCASTNVPQQTITLNAATGAQINAIPNFGGNDEVWYNPTADRFYGAASNNLSVAGNAGAATSGAALPVVIVADGSGRLVTTLATSAGAHSIAVDPATEHIFVPTRQAGLLIFGH